MLPPIPPLNIASGPSRSGDLYYTGGPGVTLGNYNKGFTATQLLIGAALAVLAYKVLK